MQNFKAVIIEDDFINLEILKKILTDYCSYIEIVGTAENVKDSIMEINTKSPDIVFLDITLNDGNAFDVLEHVDYSKFKIIFTTAEKESALFAFKYNAIDYIVKPVEIESALKALTNAVKAIEMEQFMEKHKDYDFKTESNTVSREFITISSTDKIDLLRIGDIQYCKAEGKYTLFVMNNGQKYTSSKNIGGYQDDFDLNFFFRIHHSYVVNINYVNKLVKKAGVFCELTNGELIPISKRKLDEFNSFVKAKKNLNFNDSN